MAISSFDKEFTLNSKKAVDSFIKMISNPAKSVKINRMLTTPEREKYGEKRVKEMLYR